MRRRPAPCCRGIDWTAGRATEFAPYNAYVVADCRTDLCELQIVTGDTDSNIFSNALRAFREQRLWNALQFDQNGGAITMTWKNRSSLFLFPNVILG